MIALYFECSYFAKYSTIIFTEDKSCMLIQPPQNNIINARTLQTPLQRYPIILNPHNNAGNTRIFVGNSPPVKVIRQP